MFNQLMQNQVPTFWKNVSYLSLKPLAAWVQDLGDRLMFWNQWITLPEIASYSISAFYFPQVTFYYSGLHNCHQTNLLQKRQSTNRRNQTKLRNILTHKHQKCRITGILGARCVFGRVHDKLRVLFGRSF